MSVELSKFQRQQLGEAIQRAGYDPKDFIPSEESNAEGRDGWFTLTHRESSDTFSLRQSEAASGLYEVRSSIPGTTQFQTGRPGWGQLTSWLEDWAAELKRENEATDPWQREAEDMASDDSYFSLNELPKVDKAIDKSLEELKTKAIEQGVSLKQVEAELQEVNRLLKKTARSSTKKEWLSLFKGIIVEKLLDWGLQTALFQSILHVLITSAHDVVQLAAHASRHL